MKLRTTIIIFLSLLNLIFGCTVLIIVSDTFEDGIGALDIKDKINTTGLFVAIDFYFLNESAPSITDLLLYDALLIYIGEPPPDPNTLNQTGGI